MARRMLNDENWSKLRPILHMIGIYNKPNLRLTIEGIMYRMRTGCPWRDLPNEFGLWNSIYNQFNRWSAKGKISKILRLLIVEPDLEWNFIDGSYVKAHQHSAGAASGKDEAIGKSRAGNTTKIHLVAEGFGLPFEFTLTGGQVPDCKAAPELLSQLPTSTFTIADKGYDSESLRAFIREKKSIPLIPRRSNSTIGNDDMDWHLYKYRHLVENVFARLKHFRAIATRYDKLKRNYSAMLSLACAYLWLPM